MRDQRDETLYGALMTLRAALIAVFWEPIDPYFVRYLEAMTGNHGMIWKVVAWTVFMVSAFAVEVYLLMSIYMTFGGG
jgi:hypothetical protein